ncbi:hypothetical protein [Acetobacterium bakii]|uniref:Uncharacterized protein n=1 Tax=Acetobacterium bakii TaxID=52689 RepID=A0A0L6TWH6_9FIRM|nr:hypothetical protein [Acetobacterium bakii]KNZ40412.1 hypothetical protein AKG39_17795 [Acetobacterium bakii]
MKKTVDVSIRYECEIREIYGLLDELAKGRIYGFPGNCTPADGELETNVDKLSEKITALLNKIEYGKASFSDEGPA